MLKYLVNTKQDFNCPRGGTQVTRANIRILRKVLTVEKNFSMPEKISICLNVSIVCARKYEMVRMT